MARRLVTQDLCDDCDWHEIPNMPAVGQHIMTANGGPPRRVMLCRRCQVDWERFLAVYEERGQAIEPPSSDVPTKKRTPKPIAEDRPKELEKAPAKPAEKKEKKPRLMVWCPEKHKSKKGHGMPVAYTDRGTHADMVHNHAKLWEIEWRDPEGILKFPCDVHTECMKTGLSFITSRGLSQHRYSCPLPRIDQEAGSTEDDAPH